MQLCKILLETGQVAAGILAQGQIELLAWDERNGIRSLSDILHAPNPAQIASSLSKQGRLALHEATLLAPVDQQEIWGAGVTYLRSREARERESVGAARFYDLVYAAERPELFFKSTARRAVGPGGSLHIRRDSHWTVPEPELALMLSPDMSVIGYTIGNDMSARDIEGENPLYLPQAKIYEGSCALGPAVTLAESVRSVDDISITMRIEREGRTAFEGSTPLGRIRRTFDELISWLGRENSFLDGAVLLTGTGIVPPDDFSLAAGDRVTITVSEIGEISNPIAERRLPVNSAIAPD